MQIEKTIEQSLFLHYIFLIEIANYNNNRENKMPAEMCKKKLTISQTDRECIP